MSKLASLMIKISANGAQAEAQLKSLESKMDDFGKKMTSLGSKLSKTLTLPITALGGVAVKAANTQLQAEAKLLTALKQRSDIQQRLIAQAAELQSKTTFGDEEIISQQAYLAALGLTEDQISSTINAAVELSAALGMDLESAVKNLAKTYGGLTGELGESIPALKGLTAEQLKQGAAIDYVNKNYKGFAEQMAKTGAGPLQQLKNKLGDMAEKLGTALLPVITKLAEILGKLADWFINLSPATQEFIASGLAIAAAFGPVLTIGGKLITLIPKIGAAFTAATGPIGVLITTLGALVATYYSAKNAIEGGPSEEDKAKEEQRRERLIKEILKEEEMKDAAKRRAFESGYDYAKLYANGDFLKADELYKSKREEFLNGEKDSYTRKELADREMELLYLNGIETLKREILQIDVEAIQERQRQEELREQEIAQLGIIGKLEAEIADINAQMPFLKTEKDIAAANDRLAKLNAELERYRSLTNNVAATPILEKATPITLNPISFGGVDAPEMIPLAESNMWKFRNMWNKMAEEAEAIAAKAIDISNVLSDAFTNVATAMGEGLGSLFTGEEFDPLKKALSILGNLLTQLGTALIAYGGALEAFKSAIKSMNPYLALGAGAALLIAGATVTAIANKPVKLAKGGLAYGPTLAVVGDNMGASHDPEVIAPLSKLREYVGGQRLELVGDLSFEISGDVMRATLSRENIRLKTLG